MRNNICWKKLKTNLIDENISKHNKDFNIRMGKTKIEIIFCFLLLSSLNSRFLEIIISV